MLERGWICFLFCDVVLLIYVCMDNQASSFGLKLSLLCFVVHYMSIHVVPYILVPDSYNARTYSLTMNIVSLHSSSAPAFRPNIQPINAKHRSFIHTLANNLSTLSLPPLSQSSQHIAKTLESTLFRPGMGSPSRGSPYPIG